MIEFGMTPGCKGCEAVNSGKTVSINHNDPCRERIIAKLMEKGDVRLLKELDRLTDIIPESVSAAPVSAPSEAA